MRVIRSIQEMYKLSESVRKEGKIIGFVPTMGYLHEGHLSLIRTARKRCDLLVVSIFVNPTQFGPNEDLNSYPRDFERDSKLCEKEGVDVIFAPSAEEMYPDGYSTWVEVKGPVTEVLCGAFRPGHFRGVTTVVAKLFNIVQPHFAVFGQKDAQQLVVIKKMTRELNFPVEIVAAPTVREKDGLAMSSRNEYLNENERKVAPKIYQSLILAKNMLLRGERDTEKIKNEMRKFLESAKLIKIQYIDIVDADTLKPLKNAQGRVMVALAAFLGRARLIDNIIVDLDKEKTNER
ncbi:MAG TPA: pantoate--beta-alanine ligase [candidate division Zixibacteria bacterium]|nr:pantoate--beta-alanine ligase [candidate division Zixibacteria bacterium]